MMKNFFCYTYICVVAVLLSVTVCSAQPAGREIVNQSAQWFAITSDIKFHKNLSLYVEGQFRYVDFESQQYQARTAIDITLNEHLSIVPFGYVYTWNYLYGEQPATFKNNEHRIWEQVQYKHKIRKFEVSHRLRLEQRFIQHYENLGDEIIYSGYDTEQHRLRYRFMTMAPLNREKIDASTYFLVLYDEAFLSWGSGITFHEPDQNRIFAGLGYKFNPLVSIQGGFLYQMLIKSNGVKQENNIGLQLQLNYNIDLLK